MTSPFPTYQPLIKKVLSVSIKELDTVTVQFTDRDDKLCTLTGPRSNAHITAVIQRFRREHALPNYQSPVMRRTGISQEIAKFLERAKLIAAKHGVNTVDGVDWLKKLNIEELERDVEALEMIREKVETENPL